MIRIPVNTAGLVREYERDTFSTVSTSDSLTSEGALSGRREARGQSSAAFAECGYSLSPATRPDRPLRVVVPPARSSRPAATVRCR